MFADIQERPVECDDLVAQGLWEAEECCVHCHAGDGRCSGLAACVVYLSVEVELEVCCAVRERLKLAPPLPPLEQARATGEAA